MSDYPNRFSFFEQKTNAEYDGDPRGDYIKAEHINALQDAVMAIEQAVGLEQNSSHSLTERIKRIERLSVMRTKRVGMFHTLGSENSYTASILDQYRLVFLKNRTGAGSVISLLKQAQVYGSVDARQDLSIIQNDMDAWKQVGAVGIRLEGFGGDSNPTRAKENLILRSAKERQLSVSIQSNHWDRLLGNQSSQPYNPTGVQLEEINGALAEISGFAYDGRQKTLSELMSSTLPLVRNLRDKGFDLIGLSTADTNSLYEWVHGTALLFGLDYLYTGRLDGESVTNRTPIFNSISYMANWKTRRPVVFEEGSYLVRRFEDGEVRIGDDLTVSLQGIQTSSTMVNWLQNSVPGSAIKTRSLSPDKLSTYDIERVIRLINEAPDNLKIDPWKIEGSDGGFLPDSIPASNMIQNVIEAINKKNNINTRETRHIENDAIKSIDANKLTGNVRKGQMENAVIQAINDASKGNVYIDVHRLSSIDITSSGQINANTISGDNLTMRAGNILEGLATEDLTVRNYLTGWDGEFEHLFVRHLEVETLSGLRDLHVENLTADNIGSLVLEAIEANITHGVFETIVAGSLEADTIQAGLITSLNTITDNQITNSALFGEAVIDSASIKELDLGKLRSGTINTAEIHLSSDQGHLRILDDTISIYDDEDSDGNRRLRVLLGRTQEVTNDNTFGLVVLGPDGTTRLYDHTGVYSAGIHNNVISNEKIQKDAVDGRVIKAGSIIADHIMAETIHSGLIASNQILANHILAGEIVARHIHADTIEARHIKSGQIETGHLTADLIETQHIKAGAITADRLSVGFRANLMRDGFDSFEQEPLGPIDLVTQAGNPTATITTDYSYDGNKSLLISGSSSQNAVRLTRRENVIVVPVHPNNKFIVSAYARTVSLNNTPVRLGLYFNTGAVVYSPVLTVNSGIRSTRLEAIFDIPDNALRANVVLSVNATNTGVYFDAIQIEEAEENQTQAGPYRSTATTTINGDNITTGRIDARHIRIGAGTVFGANNDIIDITDEGIRARSASGWAMLNSKGLEITGGAISVKGGIGNQNIEINGDKGLLVENAINRIEVDADQAFRIINKAKNEVVLSVDPETGDLRLSGTARFFAPGNESNAWSIDEKISGIERDIENIPEPEVTQEMFDALREQVDGSITTWFGDGEPTLNNTPAKDWTNATERNRHLGDLYYDNETGYAYRFALNNNVYQWKRIVDTDVTLALETASQAQAAADQKIRLFIEQPKPPYDIGDLWSGSGTNGDLMVAKVNRQTGNFHSQDWALATKYTDDTKAIEAIGNANQANTRINSLRESIERKVDIRLGMKVGFSNFTTLSATHVYLTGLRLNPETYEEELVDSDGSIYIRDERQSYAIPRQSLSLSGVPAGTSGYIAWDNTHKELYFMWYEHKLTSEGVDRTRWRKINGDTAHLNESVFILGELEIS